MAGPLEDLVKRILRRAEQFKSEHGFAEVAVSVELADGALHRLASLSAEPGYGFVTLCPHAGEGDDPREIIVPIGAVREIRLGAAEPPAQLGFSVSANG